MIKHPNDGKLASYSTPDGVRKTAIIAVWTESAVLFENYEWDWTHNVRIIENQIQQEMQ